MKNRPTSVTVIAWILIAMGAISATATTITALLHNPMAREIMNKSPIPIPVQYAMSYAGLLIAIGSGIAMLKGCNWARFLYVFWGIFGFAVGIATSPMKIAMLPGLVVFAVIVFFLFRPKANAYFSPPKEADNAQRV